MDDPTPPAPPVHEQGAAVRRPEAALHMAHEVAHQIVATVRDPLLVLTPEFRVQSANPAFYQLFQVTLAETEGQLLATLGNGQWNIPALRILLEEILPRNTVFNDYAVHHAFERIGQRTILLNARRLAHVALILLAMEDITARTCAEAQVHHAQAQLRALLARLEGLREAERTQLARDLHDDLGQHLTGLRMQLGGIAAAVCSSGWFGGPRYKAGSNGNLSVCCERSPAAKANVQPKYATSTMR